MYKKIDFINKQDKTDNENNKDNINKESIKNIKENASLQGGKKTPDDDKVGKLEKRVWPPLISSSGDSDGVKLSDGKPTVPVKPLVKSLRPPPPPGGVKLPPPKPAGIYATPSFNKPPAAPVALVKRDAKDNESEDSQVHLSPSQGDIRPQ